MQGSLVDASERRHDTGKEQVWLERGGQEWKSVDGNRTDVQETQLASSAGRTDDEGKDREEMVAPEPLSPSERTGQDALWPRGPAPGKQRLRADRAPGQMDSARRGILAVHP